MPESPHNSGETSGPTPLTLLLQLPRALRDPLPTFVSWRDRYGDVVKVPLTRPQVYQIFNPADVRHVLVNGQQNYRKAGGLVIGRLLLGEGLLASNEPLHSRHRRMVQPAFQRQRIDALPERVAAIAAPMLDAWPAGSTIDVARAMALLTLAVVGSVMFGDDLSHDASALIDAFVECQRFIQGTPILPRTFPTPRRRRYLEAIRFIDSVVLRMIAERRVAGERPDDLLSILIAARDEHGNPLTDREIRDEIVTILLAGHETTANALAWGWYLLASHPVIYDRLHDEVHRVLGNRMPRAGDMAGLCYVELVFNESLRMYPPAWILAREAACDDVLPTGTRVTTGDQMIMFSYAIHRDPRWFPNPDEFQPERFRPEATRLLPPCSFIPFGAGPRGCMGESFARVESTILIAMIMQRFELLLVPGQRIEAEPLLTLRPRRGILMTVTRRTPGP